MKITAATTGSGAARPLGDAAGEWPTEVLSLRCPAVCPAIVLRQPSELRVTAVKEIGEAVAHREYGGALRDLLRLGRPAHPICGYHRRSVTGEESTRCQSLSTCLHSLPYRALFSQCMRPDSIDARCAAGASKIPRFYWGRPSNTLFRRAGAFAAYLVDAETGALTEAHARQALTY